MAYNPGAQGGIVVVSLYYKWPIYVSMLGDNLSNLTTATPPSGGDVGVPQRTLLMRQRVMTARTSSLPRKIRRFGRDRRGVSAVEFAFIAPVMIGLYLGCAEISDGVSADRKVSLTAGALANLTAQATAISTADMGNILDASSAIIVPYSAANLKMTVSCLSIDANKNAKVKWSVTRNGAVESGIAEHSGGAGRAQHAADLQRGVLRLYADRRLHHQRHADAVGSHVHEPAHHAADL